MRRTCKGLGLQLVTHLRDGVRARAEEGDIDVLEGLCKVGVLREEAVTGMNRLCAGLEKQSITSDQRIINITM